MKAKFKHLPQFVRTLRELKGITATDFAFYLRVTPQYISNFEKGKCSLSPEYFKKVSKILSIDPKDLIKKCLADEADRLHHYI